MKCTTLRCSVWLLTMIQVTLTLSMALQDHGLSLNTDDSDRAVVSLPETRIQKLVTLLKLIALNRKSDPAPPALRADVMTSESYVKRGDVADGGEYVMGFWIPSKRTRTLLKSGADGFDVDAIRNVYDLMKKSFNKYRYVRRRTCDFSRLTADHILEYIRSGRICGRRVTNVRFALTGRK